MALPKTPAPAPLPRLIAWALLPLILLALAAFWLIGNNPMQAQLADAPPVEALTVERSFLDSDGFHLKIRAGGAEPMRIAQVQVDDAYWAFTQSPPGPLPRLSTAWIHIPYPWVTGDTYGLVLVTNTGITFEHEIEVAIEAPVNRAGSLWAQALVGGFVGVLPVIVGMLFLPLMENTRQGGMRFFLALTLGMLVFLLLDVFGEALEFAAEAAIAFQGTVLVWLVAGLSTLILLAVGRRSGKAPGGLALATFIALGIGIHNFGEGLAIGAAIATGSAALGAFLILGFSIHNVTEGIAIAAPVAGARPRLYHFAALALLAGAPAIPGIWLGSAALAPQWAVLAFAIGAGAILQVIVEVCALILRQSGGRPVADRYLLAGLLFGVGFMYVTALAIKI